MKKTIIVLFVVLFGFSFAYAQNPFGDLLGKAQCQKKGGRWVDGECVMDEAPPPEESEPGAEAVVVRLTRGLAKQTISLSQISNLCISWPEPKTQLYPLWELYICLLVDGEWWSAQYHYKPDVCGPAGITFFRGVKFLSHVMGNEIPTNALTNVSELQLREAKIIVGVRHYQNRNFVYLKQIVVD